MEQQCPSSRFLPAVSFAYASRCSWRSASGLPQVINWSISRTESSGVSIERSDTILHPALLILRQRTGWPLIIGLALVAAFSVAITHQESISAAGGGYAAFGILNVIVGLPCWLLGCWLAENYRRFPALTAPAIWASRAGMIFIAAVLSYFRMHSSWTFSSFPFTLNLFAFVACVWLGLEITYYLGRKPWTWLEWGGQWSYSLYIIHFIVPNILILILPTLMMADPNNRWPGILRVTAALILSWIFFCMVERPSHRLAIFLSRRIKT